MTPDPYGVHEALGFLLFIAVVAIIVGLSRLWARRHKPAAGSLPHREEGSRHVVAHPLPRCHVTGCPVPGYVPVRRTRTATGGVETINVCHGHADEGGVETINVCHGHADEGETYGWWLREQGFREVAS
jgi:hypothetical protein